jgi:hypothetical protein
MKIAGHILQIFTLLVLLEAVAAQETLWAETSEDKVVLSGGSKTGDWSYRFIMMDPNSNPSIQSGNSGNVYFEDENWVIAARDSKTFDSNRKTEITFFNSKTLETIAIISVPNVLKHIGKLPDSDCFYFVTKTSGKYNYDDAPLVLILVKPLSKQMERIKLAQEDHWLAHAATSVNASKSEISIKVELENFNSYQKNQFKTKPFSGINVKFYPGAISTEDSGNPILREVNNSITQRSLVYLGDSLKYLTSENQWKDDSTRQDKFGRIPDLFETGHAITMARPSGLGLIQTVNFSKLQSNVFRVPEKEVSDLGFLDSGAVRMLGADSVIFLPTDHSLHCKKITIPKHSKVSFDHQFAYYSKPSQKDEDLSEFFGVNAKEWFMIAQDGTIAKKLLSPQVASKINFKYDDFTIFPDQNFLVVNRRPRINKARDGQIYFNSTSGDGGPNRFSVFSLKDGSDLSKPIETESYCYGSSSTVRFNGPFNEWKVISVISAFYPTNGNQSFEVHLQGPGAADRYKLVEGLSRPPDLLKCWTLKSGLTDVILSHAFVTNYIRFSADLGRAVLEKQWQSPSGAGVAQLVDGSNLLFIPRNYGYSAYRAFGENGPSFVFDLHLDDREAYAIVLPDGCFAGSPGCESLLNLRTKGGMVPATALLPWRNRPAEVIKALGGSPQDVEVLTKVTERWLKKIHFEPTSSEPSSNEIPHIAVKNLPSLWTDIPTISFPIEVINSAAELEEVTVRVNGVLQQHFGAPELNHNKPNSLTLSGTASLAVGQNWIEVSAKDTKGHPSNQVRFRTILTKGKQPSKRFVIALGVSKYRDSSLNLAFAAKDATDISELLTKSCSRATDVLILRNEEVTKKVFGQIRDFLSTASEHDEVIAFCAGHGTLDHNLDYVFVGHDFDQSSPGETGIKLDDLIDAIGSSRSLNRLLLLDTCHAGQVGEREQLLLAKMENALPKGVRTLNRRGMSANPLPLLSPDKQQRFIEEMFLLPGLHRGINIIGASGGAEFALESAEWNNGVFTASLIEALRDRKADENSDARITVSELRAYLAKRVPELTGGAQKPSVVANERDQDFEIVTAALKTSTQARVSATATLPLSAQGSPPPEELFRAYYRHLQDRNEQGAASLLAPQVDYEQSGKIPKSKVLADLRGDWKRYRDTKFQVSQFEKVGADNYRFILDYQLFQGDRARSGKLEMTAVLSTPDGGQISALKAKVISAK